jgi:DNA (cytosine-5)-methyltransferase 1
VTTITTLFSGGELVGTGARAAGLTHLVGIEYDNDIANVARANGFDIITADVMSIDPATLEVPDVLHASPVCKRASGANQSAELNEDGTKEAPEDIAAGEKIAQFIDVMRPKNFTLENVYGYRNFEAFKIICAALSRNGYFWDYDNLNAADYGVPQTRRRLILRAVRGALLPNLPQPVKWVGWYEAIQDLIPTLPESQFAAWQLARLPEGLLETSLDERHGAFNLQEENRLTVAGKDEPVWTVRASKRALEMATGFIVQSENQSSFTLRNGDEPSPTVLYGKGTYPRAFLVGTNANDTSEAKIYHEANEPAQTVRTPSGGRVMRTYLVSSIDCTVREQTEPANTLVSTGDGHSIPPRAWLSAGRVVKLTPRALARFQSVPDDYILPDNPRLACTVIGNGVACKLYEAIIRGLVQ